jgi:hypothetical protein
MWGLASFIAIPLIADSIITFAMEILRRGDYLRWLAKAGPNIKASGKAFRPRRHGAPTPIQTRPQRLDYW